MTFNSVEELAEELSRYAFTTSAFRIGIDGSFGAGKTYLAQQIAGRIGGKVVSLDCYLDKQKGNYVTNLRVEEIRARLGTENTRIVLEGVCLLAAVQKVGVTVDRLIYIKRMSPTGCWLDKNEYDFEGSVDDLITTQENLLRAYKKIGKTMEDGPLNPETDSAKLPPMEEEMIRYHAEYRPHSHADYVFLRNVG